MPSFLSGETAREAIIRLGLKPHAFDGYAKWQSPQQEIRLFGVGDFAHWHFWPVTVTISWLEGAPLAISQSTDGQNASGIHLGSQEKQMRQLTLRANTWMAFEGIGSWTVFSCTYEKSVTIDDMVLAPDAWFPRAR